MPPDQARVLALVRDFAGVDEMDIATALGITLWDAVQHCYALEALGEIMETTTQDGYQA